MRSIIFETPFTKYTTSGVIGEGGSSIIYLVLDDNGEQFALKMLKNGNLDNRDVKKRFRNEIYFGTNNSHRNIIKILDSGLYVCDNKSIPFYIMNKYSGSLRSLMKNGIHENKIIKYFGQILDGVEAAHLLGITHRDLKPENILWDSINDNLVVADFGIALFTQEYLYTIVETRDDTRLANFQYASPEQKARGRVIDKRSDIFSLGLMLNEVITGEIPIGTSYKKVAEKYTNLAYLDPIIEKMISQDPMQRFYSIDDLKMELLGREKEFIQLQKLNREKSKVLQYEEIDDLLAIRPNKIVNVMWDKNILTLILEIPVNEKWIYAINHMGESSGIWGKGPEVFTFNGNVATVNIESNNVQRLIDYFKSWLIKTHQIYSQNQIKEKKEEIQRIQNEQKRKILEEEEKLNLLQNLHY